MGYAGGTSARPTYERIGDHAEAVDVFFDPRVLGYDDLLDLFWSRHDPTEAPRSTQYRAALYCHDPSTYARAQASRDRLEAELGTPVQTPIVPGAAYTAAEDYHQKWRLRRAGHVFQDLQACFPSEAALLRSTAAAMLNGFVGEGVSREVLERQAGRLGLSDAVWRRLVKDTPRR